MVEEGAWGNLEGGRREEKRRGEEEQLRVKSQGENEDVNWGKSFIPYPLTNDDPKRTR